MANDVAPNPVESPPLAPTQVHSKVGAGALGGAIAVLVVYGVGLLGLEPPAEVAVAFGTVLTFVAGYVAKS
jgi:hypothetical protein